MPEQAGRKKNTMSEPFLGQIYLVGYNFAQRGFSLCQGQLLAISQFSALFSLLGTNFGGDGRTTFGLPNLAGRTAIGQGTGPGLTPRTIGQSGGAETASISEVNMPSHTHTATLNAETGAASESNPTGNLLGLAQIYAAPGAAPNRAMSTEAVVVNPAGGQQPFNTISPFLVLNYEIALQGIFPSRS
ncbi:phage tail protein [Salipiger thiooxidans]|jgi:microcystin-dependent protein|uniref:phage tail protein n=1 Tax=Salipiger thiooxidans TaxID=282683 RepID=UPI001CD7D0AF|nr:tail fiber protein [Salipiger thiooxidans]MCA0850439.1 tail fiber protein [Salipiger thiooxidans]